MLAGHGGGETGSCLELNRVRLKTGGQGDCYPLPAGEADGAAVTLQKGWASTEILLGMLPVCSSRTSLPVPAGSMHQLSASCWETDSRTAASRAVEFPCGAGGPPSRPRWLFVVKMDPRASESATPPQLKVCCHPASPPMLALVPV